MKNPLLVESDLPLFSQIKSQHIKPAISEQIEHNRAALEALLKDRKNYTWEDLVLPLEQQSDRLAEIWGIVKHINAVRDTPEWRKEHDEVMLWVTDYYVWLRQNTELYQAFLEIKNNPAFAALTLEQKKVIDNYLRDFKLSGVSLDQSKKERYKFLQESFSKLRCKFSQNVLDATDNWFLLITDQARLKGLPEHTLSQAKKEAEQHQQTGWRFTLDYPCYHAVMSYSQDRKLREEMYKGYNTLASDQSAVGKEWDNGPLMVEELNIKQELANLLGYDSYAELALVKRMLKTPAEVLNFLTELAGTIKAKGLEEIDFLKQFAEQEYQLKNIQPWDVRYLSERLLEQRYEFCEEELREFFPETNVIQGLFWVAKQLFNVSIEEIPNCDGWHQCVKLFAIFDEKHKLIGRFYLDLYARPHKRKGAWCGSCKNRVQKENGVEQTPIAYIIANFRTPADNQVEPLLSHEEVLTLFHEFGHCLHFLFSKTIYPAISADHGVSWDGIELPSQLMENWVWEEEVVQKLSKHYKTGEPLPHALFSKLKKSKNFHIGLMISRQLEFALFDFELHLQKEIKEYSIIQSILTKAREKTAAFPVPEYNRFPNSFAHIFAGGYAAGYYSYLWSEVLSADSYNFFKENNQLFDKTVAQRYLQKLLEPGGSKEFNELFLEFRGRAPKVEALLNEWGLN